MNIFYQYGIVLIIAIMTFGFRYLPFIIKNPFQKNSIFEDIKTYLPASIMFLLVIYSLKETNFKTPDYGIKEILATVTTTFMHVRYRNVLLSIGIGTLAYILLKYL